MAIKCTLVIAFFFLVGQLGAVDLYWRGAAATGSGAWNVAANWSLTPGPTYTPSPNIPQNVDDVYFDNSFGNMSAATVLTLPTGATSTCKGWYISTPFGFSVSGAATARLDVNGSVFLVTGMNFTGWTGAWYFYQSSTGAGHTFKTRGNSFRNSLMRFELPSSGVGGDFSVEGDFRPLPTGIVEVNLQNVAHRVAFDGVCYFPHSLPNAVYPTLSAYINIIQGSVHTGLGWQAGSIRVSPNGRLHNFAAACRGNNIDIVGTGQVYLNAGGFASRVDTFDMLRSMDYEMGAVGSVLDITNSYIFVRNRVDYGALSALNATNTTLVATGSTLHFLPTALWFRFSGHTFGDVIVDTAATPSAAPFQFYGGGTAATHTPTMRSVIVRRNLRYTSVNQNLQGGGGSWAGIRPNSMQVTQLLEFAAGYRYVGEIGRTAFHLVGGATLRMQGTCEQPIWLEDMTHNLAGVGTMQLSNIIMDRQVRALPTPPVYYAGAGSRKVTGATVTGWQLDPDNRRILVWVGRIPTNINDVNSYDNWYNDSTWCDVTANPTWSLDPTIAPNNYGRCGSVCPPTEVDSVIFPPQSYVRCDKPFMYTEGMLWQGSGRLEGTAAQDVQVWGWLHLSAEMQNTFMGTFHLRSNRPYTCQVITANKPFNLGVLFDSEGGGGSWRLMDTLKVPAVDTQCALGSTTRASWALRAGYLHTGDSLTGCVAGNGSTVVAFGYCQSGGSLHLYDSDVFITGNASATYWMNYRMSGGALLGGISRIYFQNRQASSTFGADNAIYPKAQLGAGRYHRVICQPPVVGGVPNNFSHLLCLTANGWVTELELAPTVWAGIQSNATSAAAAPTILQLNNQSAQPIEFASFSSTYTSVQINNAGHHIRIGYLLNLWSTLTHFRIQTYINHQATFAAGSMVNLNTGINLTLEGNSALATPNMGCPNGIPSSYPSTGATLTMQGNCLGGQITINGGNIVANSSATHNLSFVIVNGNTVSGAFAPFTPTDAILSGTTTGWVAAPNTPRLLRWVHSSPLPSSVASWQDPNNWEQILPFYAPPPQCPPTRIDTVLFNATSFSAANQVVDLVGTTDVASMYWENIPAALAPRMQGLATQVLTIRGNLFLHENMLNNHAGAVHFRGTPSADFPIFYIRSRSRALRNDIHFIGDVDQTTWLLLDSLFQNVVVDNSWQGTTDTRLYLTRGRLFANGNNMSIAGFHSTGTSNRFLDISNVQVTLRGRNAGHNTGTANQTENSGWFVSGTIVDGRVTNFDINAENSTILFAPPAPNGSRARFTLGGRKYNRIIIPAATESNLFPIAFRRDTVNYYYVRQAGGAVAGAVIGNSINVSSIYVRHADLGANFDINSAQADYDTLFFRQNANITTSNRYHRVLSFAAGKTYNLSANTVQWIANSALFDLNGQTAATIIQFYGVPTGQTAYIRKDSGFLCADYVNIRDVWAVGNGNNLPNTCYGNTTNSYCPHANAWIASSCDTVTSLIDDCGAWTSSTPTRGRADFNLGTFADLQGGNTFGWDKRPYPVSPTFGISTPNDTVCTGDTTVLTFFFRDITPPILFTFDSAGTVATRVLTLPNSGFGTENLTGSGTVADPYIWQTSIVADVTNAFFEPLTLSLEQCTQGNGATKIGSTMFTVDCNLLLSTELLLFHAQRQQKDARLHWSTSSETNTQHFALQRSTNGSDWQTIYTQPSAGYSRERIDYQYIDRDAFALTRAATLYYRLHQVDLDQTGTYSPIRALSQDLAEQASTKIYPNPTRGDLYVDCAQPFNYRVFDALGKPVATGTGSPILHLPALPSGTYVLEIQTADGSSQFHKFLLY